MHQFLDRMIGGMQYTTAVLTKPGHITKLIWKSACELILAQTYGLKIRLTPQLRREGPGKLVLTQVQRYFWEAKVRHSQRQGNKL